jgi:glucosamine-6-phosphate deaminase
MILPDDLLRWCSIPAEELPSHRELTIPIEVVDTPADVYEAIAREMFRELSANEVSGVDTKWVLPCGPMGQYPIFAELVNASSVDLNRLHVFHMDDFLDWQGRPLPDDHPFSMRGAMLRNFYGRLDDKHVIPEANRHFPDVYRPDALSEAISMAGGVDTVWGGIGYRGHVAFNEPPRSPWHVVTLAQFAESKTRIVPLNDDTLIAMSQRSAGGCSQVVPPLGLTIGMADLLAARRVRLFSTTGAWKQAVIRVAAFAQPSLDYPVTLFAHHPNASLLVDAVTAAPPLVGFGV